MINYQYFPKNHVLPVPDGLDIFWIKDRSLADLDNLPPPEELASDIIESLQSALASFQSLSATLGKK